MKVPAGDFTYTIVEIASRIPLGRAAGTRADGRASRATDPAAGTAAKGAAPWTGRTSWRRASRDRRSSTTPRRRPGTVHVGSLRGPVILDVITRALRARGLETTLLYGVDDMDPMDAQALLTPDAVEREMGAPARPRPRPGGRLPRLLRAAPRPDLHRHVRRPRDPPRPLLLDERHLPDRADGPVHPDRPRPGARSCATSTAASRTSSSPRTGCRWASSARTAARSARRSRPTGTARRSRSPAAPTS